MAYKLKEYEKIKKKHKFTLKELRELQREGKIAFTEKGFIIYKPSQ